MADARLVTATKMLFYGGMRIKPGVTFTLTDPAHFSATSMAWAPTGTRDDLAAAVDASPKAPAEGGLGIKQKRPGGTGKASLTPDPGI